MSRYQKGKTNLDFTQARDSEWQWHQLDHMQVCTSLQTDNHASTPPLSFSQAGCPSCHPTNSVKALKARVYKGQSNQCSRQVQLYPVFVEKLEFDVEHLAQLIKLELVLLERLLSLHTTLPRLRVNPECIVLHSVTDIPQQVIIIIMTINNF